MASAKHAYRALTLLGRAWTHAATPSALAAARPARCAMVPAPARRQLILSFSTTALVRNAAPAADDKAASPDSPKAASASALPGAEAAEPKSSCPAGTVLNGLNYVKGQTDPVALRDEEYPEWLWNCLDVVKSTSAEDADMGDEFSKSKKQRRLAAKRQRELEARLAEGDVTALAPKIPLHQQTINLPVTASGAVLDGQSEPTELADTLAAEAARRALRVAMRKARRAKIKEDNYLRSM